MAKSRTAVDWSALRRDALQAAAGAYSPYSGLRVGAAGIDDQGRVFTGCNVENASYGLTLCAECGLVSALCSAGGTRLVAVSVCAGDGAPLTPCGRCRQLLHELGGPGLMIDDGADRPPLTVADLLPGAFGSGDLTRRER